MFEVGSTHLSNALINRKISTAVRVELCAQSRRQNEYRNGCLTAICAPHKKPLTNFLFVFAICEKHIVARAKAQSKSPKQVAPVPDVEPESESEVFEDLENEVVADSDVIDSELESEAGSETDEEDTDVAVVPDVDLDDDFDDESGIDLSLADVQCSGREASIRRAIEERREARRLRDDLDYLDIDD